jgi:hypothetical protein
MTSRTELHMAMEHLMQCRQILSDNEWRHYLEQHLAPAYHELERQLSNLSEK